MLKYGAIQVGTIYKYLKEYLAELKKEEIDALVLGYLLPNSSKNK